MTTVALHVTERALGGRIDHQVAPVEEIHAGRSLQPNGYPVRPGELRAGGLAGERNRHEDAGSKRPIPFGSLYRPDVETEPVEGDGKGWSLRPQSVPAVVVLPWPKEAELQAQKLGRVAPQYRFAFRRIELQALYALEHSGEAPDAMRVIGSREEMLDTRKVER